MEAKQTSLIDLLERIPQGARLVVEHDQFSSSSHPVGRLCHEAAAALRAALAQQAEPVQEPVAWMTPGQDLHLNNGEGFRFSDWTPLYPAPPQRKPLTEEDVDRICASLGFAAISPSEIVRAVEMAHGIGETK